MMKRNNKDNLSDSSRLDIGLDAAAQPLTRGASEWQPKVFVKTFGWPMACL